MKPRTVRAMAASDDDPVQGRTEEQQHTRAMRLGAAPAPLAGRRYMAARPPRPSSPLPPLPAHRVASRTFSRHLFDVRDATALPLLPRRSVPLAGRRSIASQHNRRPRCGLESTAAARGTADVEENGARCYRAVGGTRRGPQLTDCRGALRTARRAVLRLHDLGDVCDALVQLLRHGSIAGDVRTPTTRSRPLVAAGCRRRRAHIA